MRQARADQDAPGNLATYVLAPSEQPAGGICPAASTVGSRLKILLHYFNPFVAALMHFLYLFFLPLLPLSCVLLLSNESVLLGQLYCCSDVRRYIHQLVSSVDDISVPEC